MSGWKEWYICGVRNLVADRVDVVSPSAAHSTRAAGGCGG